ncbi:MAG: GNAT family N-acetyltransferase [Planctomycetota bacterium]
MSTPAVRLRPLEAADLPVLYAQQDDSEACDLARVPQRDRLEFERQWERIRSDAEIDVRVIDANGAVAGYLVCFASWDPDAPPGPRQVGYWLGREYWGRGLATTALRLFLEELDERPLMAFTSPDHRASQVVLERCGFTRLSVAEAQAWLRDDETADTAVYRIEHA